MEQITMDFDAAKPQESSQPKILSVSDVNRAVKNTLENGFKLIWMKGELSNFKPHTSGHWYFSLKDPKAQISAVMFKGFNQGIKFRPRDGMEVIVRGKITVYEPRGNYQMFCEMMEPVGAGALQMAFEQLKKKLELEGLFAKERKRPLPLLPRHVAVVTSPTGAAIRDILNVLHRRFKGLRVTVVPTVVQGEAAAPKIVEALQLANRMNDVDVIICGRGGGSVEDMWCFNDERVARAIAASRVPLISAVGHEIDFTIADFVADLRAPTPSAAAELVSRNAQEICETINLNKKRLWRVWTHKEQLLKQRVHQLSKRLVDPKRRLQDLALRCDELTQRLEAGTLRYFERRAQAIKLLLTRLPSPRETVLRLGQEISMLRTQVHAHVMRMLELRKSDLGRFAGMLDSLSPLKVVERGYSITRKEGKLIKASSQLKAGDAVELQFAKGKAEAKIEKVIS
jgi:exodeoxyribonuclease VII large subunit